MTDSTTTPDSKRCTKCHQTQPLSMFSKWSKSKDGLNTHCKGCNKRSKEIGLQKYEQERAENLAKNPDTHTQECTACKSVKPLRMFSLNKYSRYGYCLWCKDCAKKAHKKGDKAKERERSLERYHSKRNEIRERIRNRRKSDPQFSQSLKANVHLYRARKKGVGGRYSASDIETIMYIQQGHCAYCYRLNQVLTIEHIIPVTRKGSSNDPWNICLACFSCNSSKGDKLLEEWVDRWYLR